MADRKRPISPLDMRITFGIFSLLFIAIIGISSFVLPGVVWKWGTIVILAIYGYNFYGGTTSSFQRYYGNEPMVCIVGSGFSGVCMAIKLKQEGIPFVVIEKNPQIGGTWYDNRYPGCACDVMSVMYQFSFHLNPRWSCLTAPAEEINDYLIETARHYNVVGNIRFNLSVVRAKWTGDQWSVKLSNGEESSFKYLVSGCGPLRQPVMPNIPGVESFKGPYFHAQQWDHSCDLTNKRVALVGCAASGIQIAQAVINKVEKLFVFQRTPNWYIPRYNPQIPELMKMLFSVVPVFNRLMRWCVFWTFEVSGIFLLRKTRIAEMYKNQMRRHTEIQVDGDQELFKKLTPDYDIGCKRILLEDGYLAMFKDKEDTAKLVTDHIEKIDEQGVMTKEKSYKADIIIYATGFSIEESICGFHIKDREGKKDIKDYFAGNPTTYLGITVPKFPNFFFLLGPNTVLAHNSVIYMIECQVTYIVDCIKQMETYGIRDIEVKSSVVKKFGDEVALWTEYTPFATAGCNSWYKNKDGKNIILWPSNLIHYWWLTRTSNLLRDYVLRY